MGKRGPKPTPTALLRARGSWRGNVNRDEPTFDATPPACPEWIDDRAKEFWAAIQPGLSNADVLRTLDEFALARYCQLLSRWRKCEEWIQKHGDTYPVKNDKGEVVGVREFPQVRRASDLSGQLVKLEAEFGLTPSARSRIVTGADPSKLAPVAPASAPPVLRIAN